MADRLARKVDVELNEDERVVLSYRGEQRYLTGDLAVEIATRLKGAGTRRGMLRFRKTEPRRTKGRALLALGVRGGALLVAPYAGGMQLSSGPSLASMQMCGSFQRMTGLEPGSARWVTVEAAA